MKKFLAELFPPEFNNHPQYFRALVLGVLFVALIVLQLFSYEKFYDIVFAFGLPGGEVIAFIVAALLPILEVSALPFLFSMKVAKRTRRAAKWSMIAVVVLWLGISIWTNIKGYTDIETGLMGATLPTMNGVWFVAFCALWLWSCILTARELPARKKKSV